MVLISVPKEHILGFSSKLIRIITKKNNVRFRKDDKNIVFYSRNKNNIKRIINNDFALNFLDYNIVS